MTNKELIKLREETRRLFQDKFGDIVFDEGPHTYTIDGVQYTPVSSIIEQYENTFDVESQSKSYAEKNGLNQDDVKRSWKWTNKCATIMGTRAHEFGESYTNLKSGHPELLCEQNKAQYVEEENWLVPTFPQEFAVKGFYDDLNERLHPIGAEFKLSTKHIDGAKPICGTADILFYYDSPNQNNSGFVVGDWKTNRSLTNDYIRAKNVMMLSPFDNLYDDAISHYTIQFNLYQRMMESVGLKVIARRLIHLTKDGEYKVYPIPKLDDNIIDEIIGLK